MFFDTDFLQNEEIRLVLEKTVEADPAKNWLPAYHFAICGPDGVKMGTCDLRIGHRSALPGASPRREGVPAALRAGAAARVRVRRHHLRPGQLALPENLRVRGRGAAGDRGAAGG